jgi:hypothetical protein
MKLRKLKDNNNGSFIPVAQYLVGLGVFGFVWWLTNGVLSSFTSVGIHETGNTWDFLNYVWIGIIVIYLIFGGWWLIRKYDEKEYRGV